MVKYKVGVIGNGFVGEAQAFAFSLTTDLKVYDVDPLRSTHSLEEVNECDYVFVCVPTPMYMDGTQDISYIAKVFEQAIPGPIFIIKSTVLPGTTAELKKLYPGLDIVFCPEFLTERTAKLDILTQSRIIIGGSQKDVESVSNLFEQRFKNKHIIRTDSTTAELIKYMNNTFLATKVSIMNEFKLLSDALGANWEDAVYGFASDGRIGDSHLHVPGPDGRLGYGGTCFPKDVNALLKFAKKINVNLNTILGGWITNLEVRPEKDWEADKGRAVSE